MEEAVMLDAAIGYAREGFKVFPLQPRTKVPYPGTRGVLDATDDVRVVGSYWMAYPDANIGIATGEPSGFFVVDIDPRNGGNESWQAVLDEYTDPDNPFPKPTVLTGGGGHHYYLSADPMPRSGKLGPGIDIQSTGKYIVAPPSVTDSEYAFIDALEVLPCPGWLTKLLIREPKRVVTGVSGTGDDDRPGSVYNSVTSWDELLVGAGWTHAGDNGEVTYWTRPGKSTGISASTNFENSDLLWVFSSSTEFEQDTSYSKFAAYALLNHAGDFSAAARALVDTPSLLLHSSHTAESAPPTTAYVFENAFPPDHFVTRYITYASKMTDAALEYHEAGALSLLAACTSLVTAKLAPYPKGLHTNLYIGLIGSSTRSRKSTAQRIAIDMLEQVLATSHLPSRMTTEGLIYDLASKPGLPTMWTPDEFGAALSQVYRRDYLRGLEELLLTLYGGDDYAYLKADKDDGTRVINIRRPHLSVLAASTPESLALAGPGAMLGGLLPRFGLVFPAVSPPARAAGNAPDVSTEREELLRSLRKVIQESNERTDMTFANDAIRVLNAAESAIVAGGTHVARLPTMLYKVAVLSACARGAAKVEVGDAQSAVVAVERWKQGAERLRSRLRKTSDDLQFESLVSDTLEIIENHGGTITRTMVARALRTKKPVVDQVEAALVDWGYITIDRTTNTWNMNTNE
jgi:hypothetical protein